MAIPKATNGGCPASTQAATAGEPGHDEAMLRNGGPAASGPTVAAGATEPIRP
jgi:hypothetical protein